MTAVFGSWNVPAVSASSVGSFDSSTWIGIDGDFQSDGTVEQIGTEQDVINGVPVYQAWWEMFSTGAQQHEQVIKNMTIWPGNSISASVQYITSGGSMPGSSCSRSTTRATRTIRPSRSMSLRPARNLPRPSSESAEWIMEAPSVIVNGSLVPMPMPTFSTVKFTDATAVIDGISGGIISPSWQSSADVVAVQDQHSNWVPVNTTSVLGNSGESFAVTSDSSVGAGVSQAAVLGTADPGREQRSAGYRRREAIGPVLADADADSDADAGPAGVIPDRPTDLVPDRPDVHADAHIDAHTHADADTVSDLVVRPRRSWSRG